ncbi:MAG: BspA family leucine-rich repeat surface protein [Firmicutes bacterium]|nr:BspA family leucine-rich repeat surface protein [Bacillota bacterium]
MKKRILGMIMCMCLVLGAITGCGDTAGRGSVAANASAEGSGEVSDQMIEPTPEPTIEPTPEPTPTSTPEPTPTSTPEPTPEESASEPYVLAGTTIDSGEWNGLSWLVTDADELVVTGQMEEPYPEEGYTKSDDGALVWTWIQGAPWKGYRDKIKSVYLSFSGAGSLMGLFEEYLNLKNVDLSDMDTGTVTSMKGMFYDCKSLESLDLSDLDTNSVTDMGYMFFGCESLKSLDLSSFDTSSVADMGYMFYCCESLKCLDLSNFDTGNVTSMIGMFTDCSSLESLDLSSFDTSKITKMNSMFKRDRGLTTLDLSSFNTHNVEIMWRMFQGCINMEEILVGDDWVYAEDVEEMFDNCGVSDVTYK